MVITLGLCKGGFYFCGEIRGHPFFYEYDWSPEDRQNAFDFLQANSDEDYEADPTVDQPEAFGMDPDFSLPVYLSTTIPYQDLVLLDPKYDKTTLPHPQYVSRPVNLEIIKGDRVDPYPERIKGIIRKEDNVLYANFKRG